jgi:ABC-2 type transport system ATP-binding protein
MPQPLLELSNVKKRYIGLNGKIIDALKGVSLTIYPGEIIGLLGVNGAGKTTLSSIIASLIPASEGTILFNNQSIYDHLIDYRRALGFCPQKPNFDKDLTVADNLYFAGRYYGLPLEIVNSRMQKLMKQFELEQYADQKPGIMSGGYKQRLIIARALMHNPDLVILDEPTVGLDPHIRRQLWDVILELKKEGVTVILTTHYLDEAEVLSDRVVFLDRGLIKLIDKPQNLKAAFNKGTLEDVFLQFMEDNK